MYYYFNINYLNCINIFRFESLIEREWLQAGHPFETRHKSGCYNAARSKVSSSSSSKVFHHGSGATFLLFLDCTWQIHNQFPCCFEFSTNFLSSLVDHSYCSDFSTFYGNCESDRKNNQCGKPNLWSHFDQKIDEIINPLYLPTNNVIWPSVAPFSIVSIFSFNAILLLIIICKTLLFIITSFNL